MGIRASGFFFLIFMQCLFQPRLNASIYRTLLHSGDKPRNLFIYIKCGNFFSHRHTITIELFTQIQQPSNKLAHPTNLSRIMRPREMCIPGQGN